MPLEIGAKVTEQLQSFMRDPDPSTRIVKLTVNDGVFDLDVIVSKKGHWIEDLEILKQSLDKCCYVFYKLDDEISLSSNPNDSWTFLCFLPEGSSVQDRMVYSLAKNELLSYFGSSRVVRNLQITNKDEVCKQSLEEATGGMDESFLTDEEKKTIEIKASESRAIFNQGPRLSEISLPKCQQSLVSAIEQLRDSKISYIRAKYNQDGDEISMEFSGQVPWESFEQICVKEEPAYHLLRFDHNYDGQYLSSIVFVYYICDYNCSYRIRMIYSSGKLGFIQLCKKILCFDLMFETSDLKDINKEILMERLHPATEERKIMKKAALPGGRKRRI